MMYLKPATLEGATFTELPDRADFPILSLGNFPIDFPLSRWGSDERYS